MKKLLGFILILAILFIRLGRDKSERSLSLLWEQRGLFIFILAFLSLLGLYLSLRAKKKKNLKFGRALYDAFISLVTWVGEAPREFLIWLWDHQPRAWGLGTKLFNFSLKHLPAKPYLWKIWFILGETPRVIIATIFYVELLVTDQLHWFYWSFLLWVPHLAITWFGYIWQYFGLDNLTIMSQWTHTFEADEEEAWQCFKNILLFFNELSSRKERWFLWIMPYVFASYAFGWFYIGIKSLILMNLW